MTEARQSEIWQRLVAGSSFDDLDLPVNDGRIDLRGLRLPMPDVVPRYETAGGSIGEIQNAVVLRNAKLHNLDFTGSSLRAVRLFDCELTNCRFDDCDLRDFRLWSTKVSETSFRRANLAGASLGGVQDGRRNMFVGVDFTEADLRQTKYVAAAFHQCLFINSKLEKIDFQTTAFSDCLFEGLLLRVLFYRCGFRGDAFPPNEMINVDFRRAQLRFVEFRGLTLERAHLPEGDGHLLINDYPQTLDKVIEVLGRRTDLASKKLVAYLGVLRKWAPPKQVKGVLNIDDLQEISGRDGLVLMRELLAA